MPQSELIDFEKRLNSGEAPVSTEPKEVASALAIDAIDEEARRTALALQKAQKSPE